MESGSNRSLLSRQFGAWESAQSRYGRLQERCERRDGQRRSESVRGNCGAHYVHCGERGTRIIRCRRTNCAVLCRRKAACGKVSRYVHIGQSERGFVDRCRRREYIGRKRRFAVAKRTRRCFRCVHAFAGFVFGNF